MNQHEQWSETTRLLGELWPRFEPTPAQARIWRGELGPGSVRSDQALVREAMRRAFRDFASEEPKLSRVIAAYEALRAERSERKQADRPLGGVDWQREKLACERSWEPYYRRALFLLPSDARETLLAEYGDRLARVRASYTARGAARDGDLQPLGDILTAEAERLAALEGAGEAGRSARDERENDREASGLVEAHGPAETKEAAETAGRRTA